MSGSSGAAGSGGAGAAATGGSAGAAGTPGGLDGPFLEGDCDPLVPTQCGLPFPSNVYLVKDMATPSGHRVEFSAGALPGQSDPTNFRRSDGFSPGATIITHIPGATITGLPTPLSIASSLDPDSPTVLIEAETGAAVPHFSELDASTSDDTRRAFMIRPVVRLKDATRYIVAIRKVVDASGNAIAPGLAFFSLRDDVPSGNPSLESRRSLYADIFARLEKSGVPKADLQIAWDFSTASSESNTRWLLHMRDDALAQVGADGPSYVIDQLTPDPSPELALRIDGRMTVPLYLDKPGPGGVLVLGPDGLPKQNGTAEYPFLVAVPKSAANGTPGAPLQIGHGLFGERTQALGFAAYANQRHYVLLATDWVGMASEDIPNIGDIILGRDLGAFRSVPDRLDQGLVNALLAMRLVSGKLAKDPALQFGGKSAIDPSERYYLGGSQGGIFGATYMAISTDVTRGILGVPGQPYCLLLNRSVDFDPYLQVIRGVFPDPIQQQMLLGLVQMLWDRAEPTGYSQHITNNPLPGTPAHSVLMHVAIGDHQVTTLGAHVMARAIGAKNVKPVNRTLFGIEEVDAPYTGSAMVEYDFGLSPEPIENLPMRQGNDPHGQVKTVPAATDQSDTFLRTGVVQGFCSGPCDPG